MRPFPFLFLSLCLLSCEPKEIILRSEESEPVSRAQATYKADFPFPASAENIHYFVYSDGGSRLFEFYRFDLGLDPLGKKVPPLDAVRGILREHSQVKQRSYDYAVQMLGSTLTNNAEIPQPKARFEPMSWWNPETVKQGFIIGESKSGEIFILVDEENSRIYYHYFSE